MLKYFKYISILLIIHFCSFGNSSGYVLGFKSFDNRLSSQLSLEADNKLKLSIISVLWDGNNEQEINQFWSEYNIFSGAMRNKILHITLAPDHLTAKEVYEGKHDDWYLSFFSQIKKYNTKVIFRTMHEMNGGRYPWSSNPYRFKKAWIRVYELSRTAGLDKSNILFDWSVNHRDMRTSDPKPSQTSKLTRCKQNDNKKGYCPVLEDYYPGDKYVDLVGFTFYNRGKASYDRKRLSAVHILNDDDFLSRINKLNKPIIIDEFATTAVNYKEKYNQKISLAIYKNNYNDKNKRLKDTSIYLAKQKSIVAAIYFNIDYTNGLTVHLIGEADRAVINPINKKSYSGIRNLYNNSEQIDRLYKLFTTGANWLGIIGGQQAL